MDSIIHKFARLFVASISKGKSYVFDEFAAKLIGVGVVCHGIYAYTTKAEDEIEIQNKYLVVNHIGTHFALNTNDGKQFMIPSSVWYWQFDVPEKWNKLEVGQKYKVKTYGYRIPALGLFPNIVEIKD